MIKKNIEYNTIREDFSVFECENGQILRLKTVISAIRTFEEDGKAKSSMDFKDVSNVFTPTQIDTTKLKPAKPGDVTKENETEKLGFKPLKVVINIYETENSLIIVYPRIEKIFLTDSKDSNGDPILRYSSINSVNIIDKKMFIEGPPESQVESEQK